MEQDSAVSAIEEKMRAAARAVERGDVDGVIDMFHDHADVVILDYSGPYRIGVAELRAHFGAIAAKTVGTPSCEYVELNVTPLSPDAAFSWAVMMYVAEMDDGQKIDIQARVTDVWSLIDGEWLAVHEHGSFPVDAATGRPDTHFWSS